MNIPLDHLYHYIETLCQRIWQDRVIIYRFYPHGSKDFEHLEFLQSSHNLQDLILCPYVFCNDQEPLNYQFYNKASHLSAQEIKIIQQLGQQKYNFRDYPIDIWDHAVLLHSEQQSSDLASYQQDGFVTAYYWSHAIIARDWFRFAQHIEQQKQVNKTFLIYNRAWSGTREYRLRFAELLIDYDLVNDSVTTVNSVDPESGVHYAHYGFVNPAWQPTKVLENYFPTNQTASNRSADFEIQDYENTDIEVVLETLFDDTRWHLTEKILRPIACGQPFILVATAGSLEYLRGYGFQTFESVWSESYDKISDPALRLELIAGIMKTITSWDIETRDVRLALARKIAEFNRRHFFSQEFFDQVCSELEKNLVQAFEQLRSQHHGQNWIGFHPDFKKTIDSIEIACPIKNMPDSKWSQIVDRARALIKQS
jgi:hypothetical protein